MARSRDASAIRNRMLARLRQAGFNASSTGSLVRSLSDVWAADASQVIEDVTFIASQQTLSGASGGFLDLLGQLTGTVRLPPQPSSVSSVDEAIRFYVDTGYLSDYLPTAQPSGFSEIPSGTRVSDATGVVVYEVPQTLVPAGVTEIYVDATAIEAGPEIGAPAGVLTSNSLNEPNVKVTNPKAISSGSDTESDSNFRYRIASAYTTQKAANETAIRVAALLTPGISDIQLFPNAFGPGTYDVLLVPEGTVVTQEQIGLAQVNIRDASAFGMSVRVKEPDYLTLSMVIHVTYQAGQPATARDQAVISSRGISLAYIAEIPIGGTFSPAVLERRMILNDSNVLKAEILVLCVNGVPVGVSDYTLNESELFIPDSNFVEAVEVVV